MRKVYGRDVPPRERKDFEEALEEWRADQQKLTEEIVQAETELNARVYALFQLTPEEILLVEENADYAFGEI